MKHKRIKTYLKLGILLFGISAIINSCQKDIEHEEDLESHDSQLFSTIDFRTFKSKIENKDISNSDINGLVSPQTVPIGELQYTIQSETENFVTSIDSTDVLMAEKDGVTSFTFKTQTTDMTKTTNYVLAHDNDSVDEFYITYEDDGSGKIIDPTSGHEVTTQSTGSTWCPIASQVWLCYCADHELGSCVGFCSDGFYQTTVITYEYCGGLGGGEGTGGGGTGSGSGGGDGDGEGTGGGSGDGSTGGNDLPIDGPITTKPLLSEEELGRRRECNKIKDIVNSEDQTYMNKVKDLKNKANLPYETTVTLSVDETINEYQGADNSTLVDVPLNPSSKYTAVSHVHPQNDSIPPTYSVPSLGDLVWIAESLDDSGIRTGKFVAFLTTADGTYFALTLKNSEKLRSYFNYRNAYRDDITSEQRMQYFSEFTQEKSDLMLKYYNHEVNALIKTKNQTNIQSLTYFMEFLDKADLGVEVFKTNENFDNFQQVKLNDSGSVVYEDPCELE